MNHWDSVVTVTAAAATIVIAVWLLAVNPGRRPNRVFFHLLMLHAATIGIAEATRLFMGDENLGLRMKAAFLMPLPFVALYFASVHPRPRTWFARSRFGWLTVLLVILVLEVLYFVDHAYFWVRPSWFDTVGVPDEYFRGVLYLTWTLLVPVYGWVGWIFGRHALAASDVRPRNALLWVALAFALFAAYQGAHELAWLLVRPERAWSAAWFWWTALIPVGWLLVDLVRAHDRSTAGSSNSALWVAGALIMTVSALGMATGVVEARTGSRRVGWISAAGALSHLTVPVLVAVALVKDQLFEVRLKLRWTVQQGTALTIGMGALLVVAFAARSFVPADLAFYVELASAVALIFAIKMLQGVGHRVASTVVPVGNAPDLDARKLDIYKAALKRTMAEGDGGTTTQSGVLQQLRRDLQITDRDHAILEHTVRSDSMTDPGSHELAPGDVVLGKYEVRSRLGEGAHGITYLVTDTILDRDVALKVLRPGVGDAKALLREAKAVSKAQHDNVVTLYDAEIVGDQVHMLMEYLDGGSLKQRIEGGPLGNAEFRIVADGLLGALEAVHASGSVHLDVKPSNVLMTASGEVRLADFGVARARDHETTVVGLAAKGTIAGTVKYMSPEQARGNKVTSASDLYSAAVTLFEAWTGTDYIAPHENETAAQLQLRAAVGGSVPPGLRGGAPMIGWFEHALRLEPGERFADAAAMRDALHGALDALTPE